VPAGDFESSLQLIESGLLQEHGINKIAIAVLAHHCEL
jgi:hypothetical protein